MGLAKARASRRSASKQSSSSARAQHGRLGGKANGARSAIAVPAQELAGSSSRGKWAANLNGRQPRRSEMLPQKRQKGF